MVGQCWWDQCCQDNYSTNPADRINNNPSSSWAQPRASIPILQFQRVWRVRVLCMLTGLLYKCITHHLSILRIIVTQLKWDAIYWEMDAVIGSCMQHPLKEPGHPLKPSTCRGLAQSCPISPSGSTPPWPGVPVLPALLAWLGIWLSTTHLTPVQSTTAQHLTPELNLT